MSNFLDQIIMEDVAAHCPKQFMEYHKCVSQNHEDPSQCHFRQKDLAKCIQDKVPSVQRVMNKCGDHMKRYEKCIRENMEARTINENCLKYMKDLRECAEGQMEKDGTRPINEMFVDKKDGN